MEREAENKCFGWEWDLGFPLPVDPSMYYYYVEIGNLGKNGYRYASGTPTPIV